MRILIADKDASVRMLVATRLQARHYEVLETDSSAEVLRFLERETIDLIILSTAMERVGGNFLIEKIRNQSNFLTIPIMLLAEENEIAELVATRDRGFDDFITKPFNPLVLQLRVALNISRNRQRVEANALTHLPGNYSIERVIRTKIECNEKFSVIYIDINHFKSFNDKYGHLTGDEVLKYFSSSMRLDLEDEENVPFRFGGDEFIMVFPNKTPADAYRLATRLRKNIRTRSCLIKGRQVRVTFSGGIAGYPTDGTSVEEMLDKADKALYYSKNHGRSRITQFTGLGHKELLQTVAVLVILLFIGMGLYVLRDSLAAQIGSMESAVSNFFYKAPPAPPIVEAVQPVETKPAEPVVPPKPAPPTAPVKRKIYLESGRVITGIIRQEDEESLTVEVAIQQGKGMLQIKKSQVLRMEDAAPEPKTT